MNFEELQKAWQAQPPGARVTLDTDRLLKEVRRKQRQFSRMILWRDIRELVVLIPMGVFFMHHGWRHDWTDVLVGAAILEVGLHTLVDCCLQYRKRPVANDSLKSWVEHSLQQVNHQIWLLENIFWWYLLPVVAALQVGIFVQAWHARAHPLSAVSELVFSTALNAVVYWGVYWLNQYAVKKSLKPRREQLENLFKTLE